MHEWHVSVVRQIYYNYSTGHKVFRVQGVEWLAMLVAIKVPIKRLVREILGLIMIFKFPPSTSIMGALTLMRDHFQQMPKIIDVQSIMQAAAVEGMFCVCSKHIELGTALISRF